MQSAITRLALLNAVLTVLWIVGLTNAVNLLDNMDGLAGGIGLIAALYLAFFQQFPLMARSPQTSASRREFCAVGPSRSL